MAHTIRFTKDTLDTVLSDDEVRDIIEMLYRWGDDKFNIIFAKKHKRWRGLAQWDSLAREHNVTLYIENIKRDYSVGTVIAGSQKAPSVRAGVAMVLAHELQHCNQVKLHKQDARSGFYGQHHYWNLPCEREARGFVDDRMNEICAYFGLPPVMRRASIKVPTDTKELQAVIRLLLECDGVTSEDINDELRASHLLSPANVSVVKEGLRKAGVEVQRNKKVF